MGTFYVLFEHIRSLMVNSTLHLMRPFRSLRTITARQTLLPSVRPSHAFRHHFHQLSQMASTQNGTIMNEDVASSTVIDPLAAAHESSKSLRYADVGPQFQCSWPTTSILKDHD